MWLKGEEKAQKIEHKGGRNKRSEVVGIKEKPCCVSKHNMGLLFATRPVIKFDTPIQF